MDGKSRKSWIWSNMSNSWIKCLLSSWLLCATEIVVKSPLIYWFHVFDFFNWHVKKRTLPQRRLLTPQQNDIILGTLSAELLPPSRWNLLKESVWLHLHLWLSTQGALITKPSSPVRMKPAASTTSSNDQSDFFFLPKSLKLCSSAAASVYDHFFTVATISAGWSAPLSNCSRRVNQWRQLCALH